MLRARVPYAETRCANSPRGHPRSFRTGSCRLPASANLARFLPVVKHDLTTVLGDPLTWYALGFALITAAAVGALVAAWRRFRRRRKTRERLKRARQAELRAAGLLRRLGYRVLGAQVLGELRYRCDGAACTAVLRADYLVRRHRRRYVVEVKSGACAPSLEHIPTRRQLLEYSIAFDADGVALLDMESESLRFVEFISGHRAMCSGPRLSWLAFAALAAFALAIGVLGCAAPSPVLGTGSTTPVRGVEGTTGFAWRQPLGDLQAARQLPTTAPAPSLGAGGVPVVALRTGLRADLDLGLSAIGPAARVDLRKRWVTRDSVTQLSWFFAPELMSGRIHASAIDDPSEKLRGARASCSLPLWFAISAGGIYEMWLGPRLRGALHRADGETLGPPSPDREAEGITSQPVAIEQRAALLSPGGVVGMAIGWSGVHLLAELAADYEWWFIDSSDEGLSAQRRQQRGWALTPAVALRWRLGPWSRP